MPANATRVSWYGKHFHGRRTASGERFNMNALTAASKTLRFGTRVRLTYKRIVVIVRINDRGPYVRGRKLDISAGAARKLHCAGVCDMKMEIVK
jgi:rare lipoprotein A